MAMLSNLPLIKLYRNIVAEQAAAFLSKYPHFTAKAETLGNISIIIFLDFPGEGRQNYMVLKGVITA